MTFIQDLKSKKNRKQVWSIIGATILIYLFALGGFEKISGENLLTNIQFIISTFLVVFLPGLIGAFLGNKFIKKNGLFYGYSIGVILAVLYGIYNLGRFT